MTFPKHKVVLVTGVNGYLASNIATVLLNAGYHLRGTCRSMKRVSHFLSGPWKSYADRIHIIEVPDICRESAFDEAVKGILLVYWPFFSSSAHKSL